MFVLDTLAKTTLWGGTRLQPYGADPLNPHVGSLYTVAGNEELTCTVLNGEFIGMTLYDVYREHRGLFGSQLCESFPLLIGLVDAREDLSIQIHPSDAYAQAHEGAPFGKTESWLFLKAPACGSIVNGCNCQSVEALRTLVQEGRWDEAVGRLPVKEGDYVFVETGTLHALCAGSLVYEIQQSTDVTYRFYDYDRVDASGAKRPLQLEQAMENVDPAKASTAVPYERDHDYDEAAYTTRRTTLKGTYENPRDVFVCATLLSGSLCFDSLTVTPGMSVLILPNETVSFSGAADVMLAWPR